MSSIDLSVVLLDDESALAGDLRAALEGCARVAVLGSARDVPSAVALCESMRPAVIVMSAHFGGAGDAAAVARALVKRCPGSGFVFVASSLRKADVSVFSGTGAESWAYVRRPDGSSVDALVRAIEGVASGLVVVDPEVADGLAAGKGSDIEVLTRRQREVLSLMARGLSNGAIARTLVLEEKSVENHINAIFSQLVASKDHDIHPRVRAVLTYLKDAGAESLAG